MRILLSDVHGGYTDALLAGAHDYLFLPAVDGRGGLSRLGDAAPARAREVDPAELRDDPPDVVLLQRPGGRDGASRSGPGCGPASDVPAVFLEHNTPKESVPNTRHPLADGPVPVVHVTHLNALLWDCGRTPTPVVEHGLADPGLRYVGDGRPPGVRGQRARPPLARDRHRPAARFAPLGIDAFGIDGDLLPAALDDQPGVAFAGNLKPPQLRDALVAAAGVPAPQPLDLAGPVADRGDAARPARRRPGHHGRGAARSRRAPGRSRRTRTSWSSRRAGCWPTRTRRGPPASWPGRRRSRGTGWPGSSPTGTACLPTRRGSHAG